MGIYEESSLDTINEDVIIEGSIQGKYLTVVADATAARTITSADFGKVIVFSKSDGAVAVTLPANGAPAGAWFKIVSTTAQDITCTASANTMITTNDVAATSVKISDIGAAVLFISNGSYWIAVNQGLGATMTVA